METEKLYYQDAYLRQFTAKVFSCEEINGGYRVVLDRTAFYPEGGGQACDLGTLGGRNVLDVQEQGEMVNAEAVFHLFETELGRTLRSGAEVIREFKFSILDDGENYASGLEGEKILLQGVVDCALIEPDGITIVDFKTDYVMEDSVDSLTEKYSHQVRAYADALARIYQLPVKSKYLYLFHIDRFVEI